MAFCETASHQRIFITHDEFSFASSSRCCSETSKKVLLGSCIWLRILNAWGRLFHTSHSMCFKRTLSHVADSTSQIAKVLLVCYWRWLVLNRNKLRGWWFRSCMLDNCDTVPQVVSIELLTEGAGQHFAVNTSSFLPHHLKRLCASWLWFRPWVACNNKLSLTICGWQASSHDWMCSDPHLITMFGEVWWSTPHHLYCQYTFTRTDLSSQFLGRTLMADNWVGFFCLLQTVANAWFVQKGFYGKSEGHRGRWQYPRSIAAWYCNCTVLQQCLSFAMWLACCGGKVGFAVVLASGALWEHAKLHMACFI